MPPETIARRCAGLLIAGATMLVALTGPALAQGSPTPSAATVTLRPGGDPAAVARMVEELRQRGIAVEIQAPAPDPGAAPAPARTGAAAEHSLWASFRLGLRHNLDGLTVLPRLLPALREGWQANRNATGPDAAGLVLAVLATGAAAAMLIHLGLSRLARRKLEGGPEILRKLKAASLQAAIDGAALAGFLLAGEIAADRLLPLPDLARDLARTAIAVLEFFGLYLIVGRFLLSPQRPDRRLMPLPNALWHWRILVAYGLFGPVIVQSIGLLERLRADPLAIAGWFLLGGTLIFALKIWWFYGGRHDIARVASGEAAGNGPPSVARGLAAAALPWLNIAVAVLIWLIAQVAVIAPEGVHWGAAGGLTQILIVILPIVAAGVSALVQSAARRALERKGRTPGRLALLAGVCALATGLVWIACLAVLVRLWSVFLLGADSGGAITALKALLTVAAAVLTGWVIWTVLHTYFEAHAPRRSAGLPGDEDEGEVHVQSRLATVLPLVRGVALGAVLAITGLVVLSSIGVEIAPFLAGFGVIGLAFSFGSQALVRDIVSGIFFMADDAFRVGEYIDSGKLKGTVEKISLRSVQLRHQNGQVHTIPFGQLQSITNFSRDWATMKFTLRLDRDADIEKARKVIKKVGQDMMADPELGPELLLPLKMQGVHEIADAALVVRLKFTCKPTKPTYLQREALKRVYRALQAAEVPFASNAVTVRGGQEPNAAAAATTMLAAPPLAANA